MKRIICIGNRYIGSDALGPRVYDWLARQPLPPDVALVDGGLAGLHLLSLVESAGRVVFVDALSGSGAEGMVVVTGHDLLATAAATPRYDHAHSLLYLLGALPFVVEKPPELFLVGATGTVDEPLVAQVAHEAIEIACNGSRRTRPLRRKEAGMRGLGDEGIFLIS
jgi:hydrogenase maturation protease